MANAYLLPCDIRGEHRNHAGCTRCPSCRAGSTGRFWHHRTNTRTCTTCQGHHYVVMVQEVETVPMTASDCCETGVCG